MRGRLLLLALVMVPVLSGAVIGRNGALIDRAMLPLGGALGANAPASALDPCNEALAAVNYSAKLVAGTDNVQEISWANAGTAGAPWDLDTATSGGLTYQQAGDCSDSPYPCLVTDGTGQDKLSMSADASPAVTWAHQLMCLLVYYPTGGGVRRFAQVSGDTASRNVMGSNGPTSALYIGGGSGLAPAHTEGTLLSLCVDVTNPATASATANGGTPATGDESGATFSDIKRIALGGRLDTGLPCANCEVHQFIAWDTDPGLSDQEMSACLLSQWQ